jgi:hypothetical protein
MGPAPLLMTGAASLVVVVGLLSAFLLTRSPEVTKSRAIATLDPGRGPGTSLGKCVEPFSVENLARRAFAFDGTITDITVPGDSELPTEVTFAVDRWYKGGEGSAITVKT